MACTFQGDVRVNISNGNVAERTALPIPPRKKVSDLPAVVVHRYWRQATVARAKCCKILYQIRKRRRFFLWLLKQAKKLQPLSCP
jgi:hypothetical protein